MKRSEMIQKLMNIDFEWWSIEDEQDLNRYMDEILNLIEKEGMLPPKNPNKYDPVPTVTPTGNHDYSFIREWEFEDEK